MPAPLRQPSGAAASRSTPDFTEHARAKFPARIFSMGAPECSRLTRLGRGCVEAGPDAASGPALRTIGRSTTTRSALSRSTNGWPSVARWGTPDPADRSDEAAAGVRARHDAGTERAAQRDARRGRVLRADAAHLRNARHHLEVRVVVPVARDPTDAEQHGAARGARRRLAGGASVSPRAGTRSQDRPACRPAGSGRQAGTRTRPSGTRRNT